MGQTLLSAHYIEGRFESINGYTRLSSALSDEVSKQADIASNPQITAQVQAILKPAVLQQKINGALDQLQLYYQGKGPVPVINLSDLASQAQAAGVPLGQDSSLLKPIPLASANNSTQAQKVGQTFDHVRLTTILTSLILIVALLVVSWERHRYAAVPDVLMNVGILMGLVALIFYLAPSLASHYIKFSTTSNAFESLGKDLVIAIIRDLARRFAIIAGSAFIVGLVARILVGRLQTQRTVTKVPLGKAAPKGAIS
jgi:hypothetical protein